MSEKSIVIVGFQFAGAACYGQLNKLLPVNFPVKITVVSDRPYFFHNVAAPRAVSDPNWIDRSFIPIDAESALLGRANTELLIDSVVNVTKDLVHLKSGKTLPFDYLILATGSSYGAPAKSQHSTMEEAKQEFRVLAEKAKQAESVLVVGGGPVGVELAAELKSAYPNKQVTLIHSTEQILPNHGLSEKAVRKTRATLDGLGVKVLVGEKVQVDDWSTFDPLTAKTLKTDKGTELKSDLQFICIGARPNTSYLKDLGVLDDRGLVKVDSSLRVEGLNNIFAIGDINNVACSKTIIHARPQAEFVGKNMANLLAKSKPLPLYKSSTTPILALAMGPKNGVLQIGPIVLGNFMTAAMKSKNLFYQASWQLMNKPVPK